jgi:hypothetical protein
MQGRFTEYVINIFFSWSFLICGKFPEGMHPCLISKRYWTRPERPALNTHPLPEVRDRDDGNKVWACIALALNSKMWGDDDKIAGNVFGALSLENLDALGIITITLKR